LQKCQNQKVDGLSSMVFALTNQHKFENLDKDAKAKKTWFSDLLDVTCMLPGPVWLLPHMINYLDVILFFNVAGNGNLDYFFVFLLPQHWLLFFCFFNDATIWMPLVFLLFSLMFVCCDKIDCLFLFLCEGRLHHILAQGLIVSSIVLMLWWYCKATHKASHSFWRCEGRWWCNDANDISLYCLLYIKFWSHHHCPKVKNFQLCLNCTKEGRLHCFFCFFKNSWPQVVF